jgi:hypothetical protein
MKKNMNIQTTTCRRNDEYDACIIGLTVGEKHTRAWWIDKDRLKIIKISSIGINCFVDGL